MRTALLAASLIAIAAPAFAADPVEGEWLTQGGGSKVRLSPCAGNPRSLCGAVSWLRNPAEAKALDGRNPDPALRPRTILGLQMVWGLKQAGPGRWTGGRIYDPSTGKSYNSKISLNPDGTLKVEGCIAVICQAQTWKRG